MNKKKIFIFYFIIQIFILYSCSKKENNVDNEQIEYKNLSYGKVSVQKLDMFYPAIPSTIKNPVNVVLFIHGGGWLQGDKSVYNSYLKFYAENFKLLAVSMNYRMFGDGANCADMLEDIHSAIAFIKKETENRHVIVNKMMLLGASAGAHLALLYSYKNHSTSHIPIAFCVSQSAPVDFTDVNLYNEKLSWWDMIGSVSKLTGNEIKKENIENLDNLPSIKEAILSVSPINYIKTGIPPTLFAHGKLDDIVPFSNAERMNSRLSNTNGVIYDFIEYPNTGHDLDQTMEIEIQNVFNAKLMEYIGKYLLN